MGGVQMVRCNLSVLLAERQLKVTKVCNDTGISRTTLTSLANNYGKGIQYDTLNTLCTYLKVTPGELISYVPVDIPNIYVRRQGNTGEFLEIEMKISHKGTTLECSLCGNAFLCFNSDNKPYNIDIDVALWLADGDADIEKENAFIIGAFHELPITFLKDIEKKIVDDIIQDVTFEYNLNNSDEDDEKISFSFSWDETLIKK